MSKPSPSIPNRTKVFVAGSAHFDVLGTVTGDPQTIDKIGDVTISVGGTGGNLAVNLASMGMEPLFMTAANESAFSRLVETYLVEGGVLPCVTRDPSLPNAAFSAHIGPDGEMMSALSSMPCERVKFSMEEIEQRMQGAMWAMADCNLSVESMTAIVRAANRLNIPVFLSAVSEAKALRTAAVLGSVTAVFMNRLEATYIQKKLYVRAEKDSDLAALIGSVLVITEGDRGAVVATPDMEIRVPPIRVRNTVVNTMGAGDALAAATAYFYVLKGASLPDAAFYATSYVEKVIERSNCNLGSPDGLEMVLSDLNSRATTDRLTGLFNRGALNERMDEAFRRKRRQNEDLPLSLIIIDVDEFKSINDQLGHDIGDEVLKQIAVALKATLRDEDLLARWGGDEFVCLMRTVDLQVIERVATRMVENVRSQVISPTKARVSVGAAVWTADMKTGVELFQHADKALYAAKKLGRNQAFCFWRSPETVAQYQQIAQNTTTIEPQLRRITS